jgi:hypothetical protein
LVYALAGHARHELRRVGDDTVEFLSLEGAEHGEAVPEQRVEKRVAGCVVVPVARRLSRRS